MPMQERDRLLAEARGALARRDWVAARDGLLAARAHAPLTGDDLFALGDAVWWLGAFRDAQTCYEDAYRRYLDEGQARAAARAAQAIGGACFMRGEEGAGSAWMNRAVRLLGNEPECAEHGYLLFGPLETALGTCDLEGAVASARQMQELGHRHHDANLAALGQMGEGRALIKQGRVADGIALLDQAMLAAVSDNLMPEWAGNIYCQMMRVCYELSDLRRAGEWTRATARWCESLQAAGPFMGVCRAHRAQVLVAHGDWEQAEQEAARVCAELADFDLGTTGEGYYQIGEIHRLRGDLAAAEEAYRQAHACGRNPLPGLALLRLAQGKAEAALATARAAVAAEAPDRLLCARLCAALVEIALAAGEVAVAHQACATLEATAEQYRTSGLRAAALHSRAAVLLGEGRAAEAIQAGRAASLEWQQINVPYEVARTRVLMARAHNLLGDHDTAALECDAAYATFMRLGAALDAHAVAELRRPPVRPGGLTEREAEVLALVAAGASNRAIATALVISEKTVARHLSNIFTKLNLPSRTAAAAFAFEHGLASRPRG